MSRLVFVIFDIKVIKNLACSLLISLLQLTVAAVNNNPRKIWKVETILFRNPTA